MRPSFDELVKKRRSVRAFEDRPVEPSVIRAVCEAARLAPSACNSQTWRFVSVTDPKQIARLCDEGMRPVVRNKWLKKAPAIIVGCSQLDIVANRIGTGVTGIEYFQLDLGIAMEHMVLKATELGLGTCWVGWFNEEKVREVLDIPKRIRVTALLALGYPEKPLPAPRSRKTLSKILFSDSWGTPFKRIREE